MIGTCDHCPFFKDDNEWGPEVEWQDPWCDLMNRHLDHAGYRENIPIPHDCQKSKVIEKYESDLCELIERKRDEGASDMQIVEMILSIEKLPPVFLSEDVL